MPRIGMFKTKDAIEKNQKFFIPKGKIEWQTYRKVASAYRFFLILMLAEILKVLKTKPCKLGFNAMKLSNPKKYYNEFYTPHFVGEKDQLAEVIRFWHIVQLLQKT